MDNLISRQAAIDEIKKHYRAHDNDLLELIAFNIGRLPSVQPERKTGEWIYKHENGVDSWECSECGYSENIKDGGIYQFCSACGTLMKKAYGVYANEWLGLRRTVKGDI